MLAMEVLDNLPHDRVAREPRSGAWLQTVVSRAGGAGARRRPPACPQARPHARERRACVAWPAAARLAVLGRLVIAADMCMLGACSCCCAELMQTGRRPVWAGAGAEALREALAPLEDGLIRRCLAAGDWAAGGKSLWHRMLDFAVGEPGAPARPSDVLARACAGNASRPRCGSAGAKAMVQRALLRWAGLSCLTYLRDDCW